MKRLCLFGTALFMLSGATGQRTSQQEVSDGTSASIHATAQSNDAGLQGAPIPVDPAVRIGHLPNGLTYYIRKNEKPDHRAELRLVVGAGSMEEDEDQLGVAHFVEHMCFNGSEHFSKNELVDYLESVGTRFGADLNAYTSFDETVYKLEVRTDDQEQLSKGLLVLQDWAGGVSFDDDEIDKERGVVISEWRSRLSAEQRMQQKYFPVMYHDSRYAMRLPIGKPEIIENVPYQTVRRFYHDWYRPELMAVCVVGDFNVDSMEQEIRTRFSGLHDPATVRPKEEYPVPGHQETLVSIETDKEATSTNIRIIYKHPYKEPVTLDDYRETLLEELYNRMLNARLYELNTTADPPFIFAYSGYGRDVGSLATYTSFARAPQQGVTRAFRTLLTENARVLRHGFLPSELERQEAEMLTTAERNVREQDKTESSRYISSCIYHFLDGEPMPGAQQTLDLYHQFLPTIDVAEINKLASEWITPENRVIILTGPENPDVPLPTKATLFAIIDSVAAEAIPPYEDNTNDAPLFQEVLNPVTVGAETVNTALDIHTFKLANGITVEYKQTDFKNDQILMAGYSMGGSSLYDDNTYQSINALGSVIRESGVGVFSAPQLYKKLTGKTVSVFPFIGERYEGFNGACSPKDFEVMLQLIYLYATQPRMEDQALQSYLKKERDFLENLLSNPNNYFANVVNKIRYENHPRRSIPTVEDLDKVNMSDIQRVYHDRFSDMGDFTFFFTGALDPVELKALASRYLGNLPAHGRKETWKDVGVRSPEGVIDTMFSKGEAPRTNVRIIYHGNMDWNDTARYDLQSLADYARIKLRESLREDMGGVYGVAVSSSAMRDPITQYSINISFNSDPPRTQELIDAATEVINQIKEGNIAQADIEKVQELQRQARVRELKENRFWQGGLIDNWVENIPLSELTMEYLEGMLKTLTPESMQAAAREFFGENKIQVVMNPE